MLTLMAAVFYKMGASLILMELGFNRELELNAPKAQSVPSTPN